MSYDIPLSSRIVENSTFGKRDPLETHLRYSTRDGRLLHANESDDQGYAMPKAAAVEFKRWLVLNVEELCVHGVYQTHGARFEASRSTLRSSHLYSEWKTAEFDLQRAVLADIQQQVREHNAVVQPVPNGPDEAVAWCEAMTRLVLARQTFYEDRRGGAFIDDFDAALAGVYDYLPASTTTTGKD